MSAENTQVNTHTQPEHTQSEQTNATIKQIVQGVGTSDGAGVNLTRVVGTEQLRNMDPFLMFDEFKSDEPNDYLAGFPKHPHRGFETVTYMLAGAMEHQDHMGNKGVLTPGTVQWMTAGRGVIHSEMPKQVDGLLWGFQLWLNLPAKRKMADAAYQEFSAEKIPSATDEQGIERKVIAGHSLGLDGVVTAPDTNPLYVDVRMPENTTLTHPLLASHAVMVYVYQGRVDIAGEAVESGQMAVLNSGNQVTIMAKEKSGVLLLAGQPLNEPIVQHGPFVMNTEAEIRQAIRDYQLGQLTA